jgi:molybdate transport system ATP-binding protein
LLCDEPVSALDLPGRRTLLDRLRGVQRAERVPILYVTHSPAEAVTLGTRLFLLEAGRIVAEGAPAEILSDARRAEFRHLEGVRNVFPARVVDHGEGREWTRLELDSGPSLTVAHVDEPPGARVDVEVDGDDVLLAAGPVAGLSARNQVQGRVEVIAVHGREAEVVVRTGELRWLVGTLASTPDVLALAPGRPVWMIIKARSVRVERTPG